MRSSTVAVADPLLWADAADVRVGWTTIIIVHGRAGTLVQGGLNCH